MAKAGDAYQAAVAEVMRQIDPAARIEVGEWVEGPDGERDCDVGVYPSRGSPKFIYVECKDRKRPVGIEFLDALESKRQDVKADTAILCSNSGFTRDALRKAARVGIPALSALIEEDSRIRVRVEEEIYTRNIQLSDYQTVYQHDWKSREMKDIHLRIKGSDVLHADRPVMAWVRDKCTVLVGMTARSCTIVAKYKFWRPLQFHFGHTIAAVRGIDLNIPCNVQWCSQIVQLSASNGMYDYLRHRVLLGKGTQQYIIQDVDFDKWAPIDFIPQQLHYEIRPPRGGVNLGLGLITGIDEAGGALAPDIDPYLESVKIERIDSQGDNHTIDGDYARRDKAAELLENRPRSHLTVRQTGTASAGDASPVRPFKVGKRS